MESLPPENMAAELAPVYKERMHMKILVSFIVISFLGVSQAFAGFAVGNGGNIVACGEETEKTVELLDHWEARKIRNLKIQMGDPDLAPEEKVHIVLSRLKKINPNRAALYEFWFRTFIEETDFTDLQIVSNSDSGPAKLDPGCMIVQIAIQQEPVLPGDFRYTIQKSLWAQLDNNGKAGLILHELIYRELANQKPAHLTSKYVRYYNAYISSDEISAVTLSQYYKLMLSLRFAVIDAQFGFPIVILKEDRGGDIHPAEVRFNEINPEWVEYAKERGLFADFHNHPMYLWHGQSLELVDPRCCFIFPITDKDGISFNRDGTPVDFSVRAQPLKIEFGSLQGLLTTTQGTYLSIVEDKDKVNMFSIDAFSEEIQFAEFEFAGAYRSKPVRWTRGVLRYDAVKDEVDLHESPNCRACR